MQNNKKNIVLLFYHKYFYNEKILFYFPFTQQFSGFTFGKPIFIKQKTRHDNQVGSRPSSMQLHHYAQFTGLHRQHLFLGETAF